MVDKTYTAASGQGIYGGRFSNTPLTDLIASMAPNTFAQLTTTNIRTGYLYDYFGETLAALETDTSRIMSNWTNKYAYVKSKRRIVGIGTSEGYTGSAEGRFRSKCLTFDLETNLFYQAWNPTGRIEGHAYDANCSTDMNGKLYRKSFNSPIISQYDINTELWSDSFSITGFGGLLDTWAIDVFPQLGASGSVILLEKFGRLFRYDIATSALTLVGTYDGVGTNQILVLVNDAIIFGGGNESGAYFGNKLYRMNSSGTVTLLSDALPLIIAAKSDSKVLPCPRGRGIVFAFSNNDSLVRQLNTVTGEFTTIGDYNANLASSVYVAGITVFGTEGLVLLRGRGRTSGVNQSEFWVYRIPA